MFRTRISSAKSIFRKCNSSRASFMCACSLAVILPNISSSLRISQPIVKTILPASVSSKLALRNASPNRVDPHRQTIVGLSFSGNCGLIWRVMDSGSLLSSPPQMSHLRALVHHGDTSPQSSHSKYRSVMFPLLTSRDPPLHPADPIHRSVAGTPRR